MLSRLSISAALAACLVAVIPALRAEPPATSMVRCIYQVSDLVVPLSQVKSPVTTGCTKANRTEKSRPTREDWLIERILNTVQPASWAAHDGAGTVDYFPLAACLVVNQTPEIQQQVAELLADLRQQQDTEVALEVRLLTVPEDCFERLGVDFNANPPVSVGPVQQTPGAALLTGITAAATVAPPQNVVAFLNDAQVRLLLEAATGDPRTSVLQTPKLTMLNGQSGVVNLCFGSGVASQETPKEGAVGLCMKATPHFVSADRRFVRIALHLDHTERTVPNGITSRSVATTVTIPDGGTAVLSALKVNGVRQECAAPVLGKIPYVNRLFKNVGYGCGAQREFVLVTPRIVVVEEQEERLAPPPAAATPLPVVLAELLKAYEGACAEGKTAEAKKFARAALILDPMCFSKKR